MIFYILLFVTILIVAQAIKKILAQRPHLTDEEILTFVNLKMEPNSEEYTRFIGHLAGCKMCQDRLDAAQSNPRGFGTDDKNIEQHLV